MRTVHLVPSFHDDGAASLETVDACLARAFDRLEATLTLMRTQPSSTLVVEQVVALEAFVARRPAAQDELRALAQEGRLEVASGLHVGPDANMPSGESLVRLAVTGQRWLEERLGVRATTCWLADSWGLPRSLPGLLRHCGYTRLVFWRGKPPWLTVSEFRWRGLDGSELLCHWMPRGYRAAPFHNALDVAGDASDSTDPAKVVAEFHAAIEGVVVFATTPHVLVSLGGPRAPTPETTARVIEALNDASPGDDRFLWSTPSRFFDAVEASGIELPVVEGEFNPVCQGIYSSRIALKQYNRRLESAIGTAEKVNTLGWLDGDDYPHAPIADAWRAALVNQSQATIAGTVVDDAYQEAIAVYRAADRQVARLVMDAVDDAMGRRVGGYGGLGIFVFNPLPRPRTDVLRLNTMAIGWSSFSVADAHGQNLPAQASGNELAFQATLPPLGYAVFSLRTSRDGSGPAESRPAPPPGPRGAMSGAGDKPAPDALETEHFQIRLRGGTITSLVDRRSGVEYVDPARPSWNDLVLQHDHGDFWLLYEAPLNDRLRTTTPLDDPYRPESPGDDDHVDRAGVYAHGVPSVAELVDDGPVRTVIRSRGSLRSGQISVEFAQQITFFRALRRIDFQTELTGHGAHYRVRVAFPTPFAGRRITHSIPFGQERRPEGEYPAQGWLVYGDDQASVVLLNRGLPGANVTDGVLMLSLLRSAAMEEKGPSVRGYEDGVKHTFSYSVIPADPAHPVEPWWEAEALNAPPIAITAADVRPREEPRLRVEPGNVALSALYLDGDQVTARLYEAAGVPCAATVWMAGLTGCRETDALSTEGASVPVADEMAHLRFRPFEIKTLRLAIGRAPRRDSRPRTLRHRGA